MELTRDLGVCIKCKANMAPYIIRKDRFCRDCFMSWFGIKVAKQMGGFRVGQENIKKVLLPISLGCCSLTLLAMLDKHLEMQKEKTNLVGYELFVLHLLESEWDEKNEWALDTLSTLKRLFPNHSYSTAQLSDALSEERLKLSSVQYFTDIQRPGLSTSSEEDLILILRNRIIRARAKELNCNSILYGDTTSRLSERILAETAKGRGFALSQIIGNEPDQDGITTIFPLRDIFRNEVEEYSKEILPHIWSLLQPTQQRQKYLKTDPRASSTRNMTIDRLMTQYIAEMELSTPSIVNNILRTSAKLEIPPRSLACSICGLSVEEGAFGLQGWGGDQDIDVLNQSRIGEPKMCYGCTRSFQEV